MQIEQQPFVRFTAITTSDTVDLPGGLADAVNVGVAGVVAAVSESGTVTNLTLPVGIHRIRVRRINATNTTATTLAALYLK
jgi:hypothetical protein